MPLVNRCSPSSHLYAGKSADGSGGGTIEELREQIIAVALDRSFLLDPLPTDEFAFKRRVDAGQGRLTLIAKEVAPLAATILAEYSVAARKIKDTKNAPEATTDAAQQLARLMSKRLLASSPWGPLQHFARYQKAVTARLEKYHADPARDAARMSELRPLEQRYWRLVDLLPHAEARFYGLFSWGAEHGRTLGGASPRASWPQGA